MNVSDHYDYLIDVNNDPVYDPEPLKAYMDKWDGPLFMAALELDETKTVLEIGVGTGRLALKAAPRCKQFCGIDISPKTVNRAKENLSSQRHVELLCADFMTFPFERRFDVIYSSLTFMHIREKQPCINKIASLLNAQGRFVLSIDKNQETHIDAGAGRVEIYPDDPLKISAFATRAGLELSVTAETEFAYIFVFTKP